MTSASHGKLIMTGDSITDCGRARPVGYSPDGLGGGYVCYTNAYFRAFNPSSKVEIINTGISGNTSRHILERWQRDILDLEPDYISLLIGVNDVWRKYDSFESNEYVPIAEYELNVRNIIEQSINKIKKFYIMTPFYIEPDKNNLMKNDVDLYAGVIRKLSDEYGLILVDLNQLFDNLLDNMSYQELAEDKVHPNSVAHMIIMKEFVKAFGLL